VSVREAECAGEVSGDESTKMIHVHKTPLPRDASEEMRLHFRDRVIARLIAEGKLDTDTHGAIVEYYPEQGFTMMEVRVVPLGE
jgi:hypothetical protein